MKTDIERNKKVDTERNKTDIETCNRKQQTYDETKRMNSDTNET